MRRTHFPGAEFTPVLRTFNFDIRLNTPSLWPESGREYEKPVPFRQVGKLHGEMILFPRHDINPTALQIFQNHVRGANDGA